MQEWIQVIGMDPSMSNWGLAKCMVEISSLKVEVRELFLIETESEAKKGVIKQSDNLRRAHELRTMMIEHCEGSSIAISEIPFCAPTAYAIANFNAGLVTGVLASCPIPMIQVFPADVKMAAIGHRQAAKEEMIEWGLEKHPEANWKMRKFKGKDRPVAANEHLADALAAVYAGIRTQQFQQTLAMFRSVMRTV